MTNNTEVKILIINSEETESKALLEMLHNKGYTSFAVNTGLLALTHLERNPVHLVLLDCNIPDMKYTEVMDVLTQQHPKIAVVVLSNNGDIRNAIQTIKHGAYDFIAKPFSIESLTESSAFNPERLARAIISPTFRPPD